jgi:hypothetical protein
MRFDSSRAWRDAMALIQANREVLVAVAGVFFLLPGIASALFLTDYQNSFIANIRNSEALRRLMDGNMGKVMSFGLLSLLLQSIGHMTMLALLTDRARPTVGQAIGIAARALPTLFATMLIAFAGSLLAVVFYSLFAGFLGVATGMPVLVFLLVMLLFALAFYVVVKLSLTMPVIVIDKVLNPFAALTRAWQLTRGNSFRIFLFYMLLALVYLVVATVFGGGIVLIATLAGGEGTLSLVITALVSGLLGAAASLILTAILAAIHRQLAGPSPEALGTTFD